MSLSSPLILLSMVPEKNWMLEERIDWIESELSVCSIRVDLIIVLKQTIEVFSEKLKRSTGSKTA